MYFSVENFRFHIGMLK